MQKQKPYALVDVDLTLVDSVTPWMEWLNAMSGRHETFQSLSYDYNLGKFFTDDLQKYNRCPYDYWRNSCLYDTLRPYPFAKECLARLHDIGYEIIFVSHCKGNHTKSKYNFLQRHFGDIMSGFHATKEKHQCMSGTGRDIFIDDRHDMLNKHPAKHKLRYVTKWSQYEDLSCPVIDITSWEDLYKSNWLKEL